MFFVSVAYKGFSIPITSLESTPAEVHRDADSKALKIAPTCAAAGDPGVTGSLRSKKKEAAARASNFEGFPEKKNSLGLTKSQVHCSFNTI